MFKIAFASIAVMAVASSYAGTYYYSGALTSTSPVFKAPNGSGAGVGQYYSVLPFTVGTSGAYTFETASPNTNATGNSNALDTDLVLYTGTFNPATPGTYTALNDDYAGTFTVLPGPFGNVSATSNNAGTNGTQAGSRLLNVALATGTNYFLVNTSYRDTSVVVSSGQGQPVGNFYTGISGVGSVNPVPEPSALAALGLGALAFVKRRRK